MGAATPASADRAGVRPDERAIGAACAVASSCASASACVTHTRPGASGASRRIRARHESAHTPRSVSIHIVSQTKGTASTGRPGRSTTASGVAAARLVTRRGSCGWRFSSTIRSSGRIASTCWSAGAALKYPASMSSGSGRSYQRPGSQPCAWRWSFSRRSGQVGEIGPKPMAGIASSGLVTWRPGGWRRGISRWPYVSRGASRRMPTGFGVPGPPAA